VARFAVHVTDFIIHEIKNIFVECVIKSSL